MFSNYFEKLRLQARELDVGFTKLIEIWKLPHVLIRGFEEHTEEANAHLETVWSIIRNVQDNIEEDLSKIRDHEMGDSVSIEQLLKECREDYETLKDHCDSLDTVLAEYGYHYDECDSVDQTNKSTSIKCNLQPSPKMENVDVEFTPDLSWKRKVKLNEPLTPMLNESYKQRGIATPVITSLAAALKPENASIYNDLHFVGTPKREPPQEPIYSRHFYNVLKK